MECPRLCRGTWSLSKALKGIAPRIFRVPPQPWFPHKPTVTGSLLDSRRQAQRGGVNPLGSSPETMGINPSFLAPRWDELQFILGCPGGPRTGWSPLLPGSDLIVSHQYFFSPLPFFHAMLPGASFSIIFALKFLALSLFLMGQPKPVFWEVGRDTVMQVDSPWFHEREGKREGFKSNLESTICRNCSSC